MANKARFYRFDLCDGHGSAPRIIAAQSKADAQNVIEAGISPHQKVQNLKHLGWYAVHAQPDEEERNVAFVVTVEGKNVEFTQEHSSHPYLASLFPEGTKEVREFLEEQ